MGKMGGLVFIICSVGIWSQQADATTVLPATPTADATTVLPATPTADATTVLPATPATVPPATTAQQAGATAVPPVLLPVTTTPPDCMCTFGTAATGSDCDRTKDLHQCSACNDPYVLRLNKRCMMENQEKLCTDEVYLNEYNYPPGTCYTRVEKILGKQDVTWTTKTVKTDTTGWSECKDTQKTGERICLEDKDSYFTRVTGKLPLRRLAGFFGLAGLKGALSSMAGSSAGTGFGEGMGGGMAGGLLSLPMMALDTACPKEDDYTDSVCKDGSKSESQEKSRSLTTKGTGNFYTLYCRREIQHLSNETGRIFTQTQEHMLCTVPENDEPACPGWPCADESEIENGETEPEPQVSCANGLSKIWFILILASVVMSRRREF